MLESTVAGIPCLIQVDRCVVVEGSFSYNAPSDWDYHGYTDIEFTVCDRRGRPAPWLERKLTAECKARIEEEILNQPENDE